MERHITPIGALVRGKLASALAALATATVPAAGRCRECGTDGALGAFPFAGACAGLAIDVTAGEELRVDSIEVAEP